MLAYLKMALATGVIADAAKDEALDGRAAKLANRQIANEYLGLDYVPAHWKLWEVRGTDDEVSGAIQLIDYALRGSGGIAVITNCKSARSHETPNLIFGADYFLQPDPLYGSCGIINLRAVDT